MGTWPCYNPTVDHVKTQIKFSTKKHSTGDSYRDNI